MTTANNQVQTEGTNLSVSEELALGRIPTTGWKNLEPNSYGNFGASFKKVPRDPISKKQQLQKGMLTDEDSAVPFEGDLTKQLIDVFGEGIFRCHVKHSGGTGQSMFAIEEIDGTGVVVAANGAFAQHTLVVIRGMGDGNDGLHEVGAGSTGTHVVISGLTTNADPPANATLEVAGFRFTTGDAELDSSGNFTTTTKDLTQLGLNEWQWGYIGGEDSDNAFANEDFRGAVRIRTIAAHKLTLDRRTWVVEQKAYLDLGTLATQLDTVVQAQTAGSAGNSITVASVADGTPAVKAFRDLDAGGLTAHIDTVIRAKVAGLSGNSITVEIVAGAPTAAGVLTDLGTHVKIQIKTTATATTVADFETLVGTSTLIEVQTPGTGATSLTAGDVVGSFALAGGTDADAPSVSEVSDAVTLHYTPGATTVAQLEAVITSDSTKIEIKTAGTPGNILLTGDDDFGATALAHGAEGTDDGAGKNIDFYFTKFYRNVSIDDDDYKKPSYSFEEEYPELIDGEPGYEYMIGNMIDEWVWNFPLTGKATINVSMVGTRTLKITGTRKTGPADALNPNTSAGVSTSTDLQRLRISNVDETGISTDFTSLKVTDKNNVSPQKQLGRLGANKMNLGKHTSAVEAECIFVTPDIIDAVRDNRDATLDILMRNEDFGALLDVQAMTLDSADRKMEKDKAVIISSKAMGHENSLSGSTDSLSVFAFLPAMPQDDEDQ